MVRKPAGRSGPLLIASGQASLQVHSVFCRFPVWFGVLFGSESDSEISRFKSKYTLGRNVYIERCTEQLARMPPDASGIPGPSTHLNWLFPTPTTVSSTSQSLLADLVVPTMAHPAPRCHWIPTLPPS